MSSSIKDIPTKFLQDIYNYFTYEQARLFDGFANERIPGALPYIDMLADKKLIKKSYTHGGYYYTPAGNFDTKIETELKKRGGAE